MNEIPFIGCINLIERQDRYLNSVQEFKKGNFLNKIHFLRVHKHPKGGRHGCFDSHLKMYKLALKKKAPYALIFEDDFFLNTSTMKKTLKLALKCIEINPDFYKISLQNSGTVRAKKTKIKGIYEADFCYLRCYIISKKAMKESIEQGISKRNHIDLKQMVEFLDKKTYLIRPALVYDRPSISNNDYSIENIYEIYKISYWEKLVLNHPYGFILEYILDRCNINSNFFSNLTLLILIQEYYEKR